jgi:hypothetical protein
MDTPQWPRESSNARPSNARLSWLSRWWDKGVGYRVALFAALPLLAIALCCSGGVVWLETPTGPQAIPDTAATETVQDIAAAQATTIAAAQATATAAANAALYPSSTPTPTSAPTAISGPVSTATHAPPPHPTNTPCASPCNPWGYNFNPTGGTMITVPPAAFCTYFACIGSPPSYTSFWNGRGYVVECQDTKFSKSGGTSGSCTQHGGDFRTLFAH